MKNVFLLLMVCFAGCACPNSASHYDDKKQSYYQSTLEMIQCANKPNDQNFPLITIPAWAAARGLYFITIPNKNKNI